ncbi:unnamed protein product, partial [Amoebophrya sp. A25]|eukprot:GSA25T00000397001.1
MVPRNANYMYKQRPKMLGPSAEEAKNADQNREASKELKPPTILKLPLGADVHMAPRTNVPATGADVEFTKNRVNAHSSILEGSNKATMKLPPLSIGSAPAGKRSEEK